MKAEAKKDTKKRNWKLWLVTGLLGIVLVYSTISVANNVADINRLKAQAAQNKKQYSAQVNENKKIKAILNSDSKDDYIEQKAREKGYVKSGETVFYDISSSK